MFGKVKTKLLLIPSKETPTLGSKQFNCPITLLHKSNDVKAKCRSLSRKFHGEMTFFTSAFAKPMKNRAHYFLFEKLIRFFAFLFCFQGHMKVALTIIQVI